RRPSQGSPLAPDESGPSNRPKQGSDPWRLVRLGGRCYSLAKTGWRAITSYSAAPACRRSVFRGAGVSTFFLPGVGQIPPLVESVANRLAAQPVTDQHAQEQTRFEHPEKSTRDQAAPNEVSLRTDKAVGGSKYRPIGCSYAEYRWHCCCKRLELWRPRLGYVT